MPQSRENIAVPLADRSGLPDHGESFAGIFPLPLTIFETFMLVDAQAGYPMMCDLELHFQGCVDRAAFDAGLAFAMGRNPLLRSLIVDEHKRLVWQPTDAQPHVDWAPLGVARHERYDAAVDLRSEIGLRIWVRQGLDRSSVLLQFHHACSDGMGGFAFVEDFLVGYAAAFPGAARVAARPLEPQRLERRQDFGVDDRGLYRRLADSLIAVREGARFMAQSPRPLPSCPPPAEAAPPSDAGFISQALSEEVTAGVRLAASNSGVAINDVLLRDLFVALRGWSLAGGEDLGRRRLRILMPQNLRQRDDRTMPAANVMSFAFLTRRANACDRPDELLQSICRETDLIRRYRLSLFFLGSLGILQSTGSFQWLMRRPFCFTTAVLTNLGDPTRRFVARLPRSGNGLVVGNLVLERFTGGAPLRPQTKAAFSIFNRAKDLSISLKCDSRDHSLLDTQRLLGQYVARLQSTGEQALARRATADRAPGQ